MPLPRSGQESLAPLATDPHDWSVSALVALLVLKGIAYGASLGALRGGPIFPAVFLGAAAGVLVSGLPGYGVVPAMATATASILQLPVSSAVLVVLLLDTSAPAMTPIVLIDVVVAFVSEQIAGHQRPKARTS